MNDHKEIKLVSPSKNFLFERTSREIDTINDPKELREMAKMYVKLYLKQQETVANMLKM